MAYLPADVGDGRRTGGGGVGHGGGSAARVQRTRLHLVVLQIDVRLTFRRRVGLPQIREQQLNVAAEEAADEQRDQAHLNDQHHVLQVCKGAILNLESASHVEDSTLVSSS